MKQNMPQTPADYDTTRIIERPDGFYWHDKDSDRVYGPFPSLMDAVQDMEYSPDTDYEPVESLEEAEAELGISEWIEPETGEPAEDTFTRLEDH